MNIDISKMGAAGLVTNPTPEDLTKEAFQDILNMRPTPIGRLRTRYGTDILHQFTNEEVVGIFNYPKDVGSTDLVIITCQENSDSHTFTYRAYIEEDEGFVKVGTIDGSPSRVRLQGSIVIAVEKNIPILFLNAPVYNGKLQPPCRASQVCVLIGNRKLIVFGGKNFRTGILEDTWIYEGVKWRKLDLAVNPRGRYDAAAFYDEDRDVVVMVGGTDDYAVLSDTWEFDCSKLEWNKKTATLGLKRASAAYDTVNDVGILFGGQDSADVYKQDTYHYNPVTDVWDEQTCAHKPSARIAPAMCDKSGGELLLFGGRDAGGMENDTWKYDASVPDWTELAPVHTPESRYLAALARCTGENCILCGGRDTVEILDTTWYWDNVAGDWSDKASCGKIQKHSLVYWESGVVALLFGEYNTNVYIRCSNRHYSYTLATNLWAAISYDNIADYLTFLKFYYKERYILAPVGLSNLDLSQITVSNGIEQVSGFKIGVEYRFRLLFYNTITGAYSTFAYPKSFGDYLSHTPDTDKSWIHLTNIPVHPQSEESDDVIRYIYCWSSEEPEEPYKYVGVVNNNIDTEKQVKSPPTVDSPLMTFNIAQAPEASSLTEFANRVWVSQRNILFFSHSDSPEQFPLYDIMEARVTGLQSIGDILFVATEDNIWKVPLVSFNTEYVRRRHRSYGLKWTNRYAFVLAETSLCFLIGNRVFAADTVLSDRIKQLIENLSEPVMLFDSARRELHLWGVTNNAFLGSPTVGANIHLIYQFDERRWLQDFEGYPYAMNVVVNPKTRVEEILVGDKYGFLMSLNRDTTFEEADVSDRAYGVTAGGDNTVTTGEAFDESYLGGLVSLTPLGINSFSDVQIRLVIGQNDGTKTLTVYPNWDPTPAVGDSITVGYIPFLFHTAFMRLGLRQDAQFRELFLIANQLSQMFIEAFWGFGTESVWLPQKTITGIGSYPLFPVPLDLRGRGLSVKVGSVQIKDFVLADMGTRDGDGDNKPAHSSGDSASGGGGAD